MEAFIETEPCEPGRTLDARLTENKTPLIGEHMTPTAWEEGSRQWIVWMIALIPAAIVLSPLILVCALGTVMLSFATLADLARIVFGSH